MEERIRWQSFWEAVKDIRECKVVIENLLADAESLRSRYTWQRNLGREYHKEKGDSKSEKLVSARPCPSFPWLFGWFIWCFLCLFQRFSGFGTDRKSLVISRFSLVKPKNQGKEGQGNLPFFGDNLQLPNFLISRVSQKSAKISENLQNVFDFTSLAQLERPESLRAWAQINFGTLAENREMLAICYTSPFHLRQPRSQMIKIIKSFVQKLFSVGG